MSSGDWVERHKLLFQQNHENIELAYLKARKKNIEHPAIIVLDLRDAEAREIAYTTGRRAEIDAQIAEAKRRAVLPIVLWHIPTDVAQRLFKNRPAVRDSLVLPPDIKDVYHVVVVSDGGISTCLDRTPRGSE